MKSSMNKFSTLYTLIAYFTDSCIIIAFVTYSVFIKCKHFDRTCVLCRINLKLKIRTRVKFKIRIYLMVVGQGVDVIQLVLFKFTLLFQLHEKHANSSRIRQLLTFRLQSNAGQVLKQSINLNCHLFQQIENAKPYRFIISPSSC